MNGVEQYQQDEDVCGGSLVLRLIAEGQQNNSIRESNEDNDTARTVYFSEEQQTDAKTKTEMQSSPKSDIRNRAVSEYRTIKTFEDSAWIGSGSGTRILKRQKSGITTSRLNMQTGISQEIDMLQNENDKRQLDNDYDDYDDSCAMNNETSLTMETMDRTVNNQEGPQSSVLSGDCRMMECIDATDSSSGMYSPPNINEMSPTLCAWVDKDLIHFTAEQHIYSPDPQYTAQGRNDSGFQNSPPARTLVPDLLGGGQSPADGLPWSVLRV